MHCTRLVPHCDRLVMQSEGGELLQFSRVLRS